MPIPPFEEPLKFIAHGCTFERLWYIRMRERVVGSLCMELYINLSLKYILLFLSAAILPVGIVVAFVAMCLFTLYMVQSFQ